MIRKNVRELPKIPSRKPPVPDRLVGMTPGEVLARAKSLKETKGKSLLTEASSLLEGFKEANLDAVLKVAPGRAYKDQLVWTLAMASALAEESDYFSCDCSQQLTRLQALRSSIYQLLGELKQAEILAGEDVDATSAAANDEEDARKAYQLAADIAAGLCTVFGLLDPACYVAMIYEAIKGNEWSSAYGAMQAAAGVALVEEKKLARAEGGTSD